MTDITEVGDLRDQRNFLISRGIDPNLDQTPCGICGKLYCDVCPENTSNDILKRLSAAATPLEQFAVGVLPTRALYGEARDEIERLSTLYSNAIARAEKAEEAMRMSQLGVITDDQISEIMTCEDISTARIKICRLTHNKASDEILRLRRMVERRDEFIIGKSLWNQFKEVMGET